MKGPRWQYLLQPPAPEGTEIAPGWHCRTVLVGPVHGASPRGMCRGRGKESRTFAARASVAVALKEGGGGGRRGRWAAYARFRRENAPLKPHPTRAPCLVASPWPAGWSPGALDPSPSIPSVSQGPPGRSRRSTSIGRDLGTRAVSQQFLRPHGVGPARAALKLAAQPKNPRCGERHGPQATWCHSSLSSRDGR